MTYVLDASAILRFTELEPGCERVRSLLHQAAQGDIQLLLSAVNWGEIVCILHTKKEANAETIIGNLAALPIAVVPVDAHDAADAGRFKWRFKVPYADAFAGALTLKRSSNGTPATLITADYDFKAVSKGTIKIEFLPGK
jgi:PIN domain nuclease of toxin-antitoxin system